MVDVASCYPAAASPNSFCEARRGARLLGHRATASPHALASVELAAPGVDVVSTVPHCVVNSVSGNGFESPGNPTDLAAPGGAIGTLVNGGLGDTFNPAWVGKVVLVQRGSIALYEKVMNAQNNGGLACVIYNNVPGDFYGTLSQGPSLIPAIGVSQENGQALLTRLSQTTTVHTGAYTEVSAWDNYSGTSMAAPHVCAAAALTWSSNPTKSNSQVRQALRETALDIGASGRDIAFGFGLIQAKAALAYLPTATGDIEDGEVGDTLAPVISNVRSLVVHAKKGTFNITWTTDELATSVIILNGTTYTDTTLVTSHSRTLSGRKRTAYTYYVRSADAAGNESGAGPFTHQN